MRYLESQNIVHKDVAARNVLLTKQMIAKIADFGLAHEEGETDNNQALPRLWTAPELLMKEGIASHKSDVWSLGM